MWVHRQFEDPKKFMFVVDLGEEKDERTKKRMKLHNLEVSRRLRDMKNEPSKWVELERLKDTAATEHTAEEGTAAEEGGCKGGGGGGCKGDEGGYRGSRGYRLGQ